MSACDDCLRRTWLIGRLAGAIELARHEKRVLRELLALPDDALLDALGACAAPELGGKRVRLDPARMREAAAAADLAAVCRHDDA